MAEAQERIAAAMEKYNGTLDTRLTTAENDIISLENKCNFQGIVNDPTIISNLTTYKSGWYWTVGTAGTYVNQECEVGDQIYCISDFNTAYKDTDFTVVQANVTEMSATEVDQICTI